MCYSGNSKSEGERVAGRVIVLVVIRQSQCIALNSFDEAEVVLICDWFLVKQHIQLLHLIGQAVGEDRTTDEVVRRKELWSRASGSFPDRVEWWGVTHPPSLAFFGKWLRFALCVFPLSLPLSVAPALHDQRDFPRPQFNLVAMS